MSDNIAPPKTPKFDALTPTQRIYVAARARGIRVTAASKEAGINRATPATWDADTINGAILEYQQYLFADAARAVAHILPDALMAIHAAVKRGDVPAAREIFDRSWGKPLQHSDVKVSGDALVKVYQKGAGFDPDSA